METMNGPILALAALIMAAPGIACARPADLPVAAASAASPSSSGDSVAINASLRDPWEGFNRRIFAFNNGVDRAVLEPLAKGYRRVTPRFARAGVSNFLANLSEPVTAANALLQAKPGRATETVGRFGVNSTIGIGGLVDVASRIGLERHEEDFGQTLGVWGVKPGIYLMLPFVGPSTVRDAAGSAVDVAFQPMTYAKGQDAPEGRVWIAALGAVSAREGAIETIADLRANSADPYVTVRSIYGQSRASAVLDGHQDVQQLPDFGGPP